MSFLCFLCCKSNDWHVKTNWQAISHKWPSQVQTICANNSFLISHQMHQVFETGVAILESQQLWVTLHEKRLSTWACSTTGYLGSIKLQFSYTSGVVTEILSRCSWCVDFRVVLFMGIFCSELEATDWLGMRDCYVLCHHNTLFFWSILISRTLTLVSLNSTSSLVPIVVLFISHT